MKRALTPRKGGLSHAEWLDVRTLYTPRLKGTEYTLKLQYAGQGGVGSSQGNSLGLWGGGL